MKKCMIGEKVQEVKRKKEQDKNEKTEKIKCINIDERERNCKSKRAKCNDTR